MFDIAAELRSVSQVKGVFQIHNPLRLRVVVDDLLDSQAFVFLVFDDHLVEFPD